MMFYKSSLQFTIVKKVNKIGVYLAKEPKKLNYLLSFLKAIHQLKKF